MKILQQEAVNAAQIGKIQGATAAAPSSQSAAHGGSEAASPAATVSFSSQAQDIAKAKAAVNAAPDVRDDLVQSLKSRIDKGEYNVSGDDIADMMLRRMAADHSANG